MRVLQRVLGHKTRDLVRVLETQSGLRESAAVRFVAVAGAELLASYKWQMAELNQRDLSDPTNVRDLLSVVRAGRIASDLGIPPSKVWHVLRDFVPHVLQMAQSTRAESTPEGTRAEGTRAESTPAEGTRAAAARPRPWKSDATARWYRRAQLAGAAFMSPME